MYGFLTDLVTSDPLYAALMTGVFAAVLFSTLAARHLFSPRPSPVRDRIRRATSRPGSTAGVLPARPPPHERRDSPLTFLSRTLFHTDSPDVGRLRKRLAHAGLRQDGTVAGYLAAKLLCGSGAGTLLVLWGVLQGAQRPPYVAVLVVLAVGVGYYLPNLWLAGRIKDRQRQIGRAVPDSLDMMVTCVEAGLGMDAALDRVSQELRLSAPLLAQEMRQAGLEMRAGVSRGEAFRRIATRTGLEELRSLAAIIVQTEIFGTSISNSLRVQAESMRIRRTQRAEERAATAGVKMVFPLIFCILTSLLVVLGGPAVVRIIRVLLPQLMGEA